ncbi:TonB-dependent receptor [Rhodohalobacter sp. SW132]|nr:TonB-dependent receptor [Rhodohalobacter sp. SW132]
MDLESALEVVEEQFDVVFLYRTETVENYKISKDFRLSTNLEHNLENILGSLELEFKNLNPKTYGIYPKADEPAFEESLPDLDHEIRGTVTDQTSGESLPGVNVVVEGTTLGTSTNIEGIFELTVPSLEETLIFSFVGYERKEVPLDGRTELTVELSPQAFVGEDVVVVGYGTQQVETLTGSISRVAGEDMTASPAPNVAGNLAGRLPGLVVNQRTGMPGSEDVNILVRGSSTFGDNSPLIVIDGVPRGNMNRLNQNDIESVTVLKDASAAIYGARAANGVVLVTTKHGQEGSPVFDLSYSTALQRPTQLPDMLDAATFAEAFNEAEWYRAGRPDRENFTPFYSDNAIQRYRDGSDPVLYPNTDWVDEVMLPYSYQHKINLQASGGTENTRYFLSFGMRDQDGGFRNNPTHYRQYNARGRFDVDLTQDLTVGANVNAIINERTYSSTATDVDFVNILQANPTLAAVYPNGLIAPGRLRENPLLLDQRGFDNMRDYPIQTTVTANYQVPFVNGLELNASYNYDLNNQFQKNFDRPYFYHEYNVNTEEFERRQYGEEIQLTDTYRRWRESLFNFRINYQTVLGYRNNVSAMAGFEQQRQEFSYASAYRKGFVSPAIPQINVGGTDPEDINNSGSASESAYNNFFGRINYDFDMRYLFEFVFRYDGSQIFPEGNRYGFFPAVSAGWRMSEEDFMRDNFPFVTELKLRASYGEIGNDRVGAYQHLQAFSFGNNYVFGSRDAPGIYSNTMPNPDITWEVSRKFDLGLDLELWDGLLGADFTVFTENRSNILTQPNLSVSRVFGFPSLPDQNIGEVDNRGFELLISHQNNVGDLAYRISANTSFARSEIVFMDEPPQAEDYQTQTGSPLGAGLFYRTDGIFRTQEELDSHPHGSGAQVGDIRIVDINGDGVIDADDRYRAQYSEIPEIVFGLNSNFRYRDFDLTLFIQGQTNALHYDGEVAQLGGSDFANTPHYRADNRWTVDNREGATMPRADHWQPGATDFFLFDATFVRLKNAELGYHLPARLLARTGALSDVRLYVNGSNLLTWAKEIKYKDPEMGGQFGFNNYPPMRMVNFGINVTF